MLDRAAAASCELRRALGAVRDGPTLVEDPRLPLVAMSALRPLRAAARRFPAATFFALAYAVSWTLWLPVVLGVEGDLRAVLFTAGVFGPPVAAVLTTALRGEALGPWLRRAFRWRVPARWWLVAVAFPVALTLTASAVYAWSHAVDVSLLPARWLAYAPALVVATVIGGGQEELGWRGLALPTLQRRWGPLRGTLLLGVVWALWHLPVVLASPDLRHGLDARAFAPVLGLTLLSVIGYAVVLTWVTNRSGSIWVAMLLHGGFNTANGALVPLPAEAITGDAYTALSLAVVGTLAVAVLALVVATRGRLGWPSAGGGGGGGGLGPGGSGSAGSDGWAGTLPTLSIPRRPVPHG